MLPTASIAFSAMGVFQFVPCECIHQLIFSQVFDILATQLQTLNFQVRQVLTSESLATCSDEPNMPVTLFSQDLVRQN